MKKNATRYCAGLLITGCAQQTFTVQNKPAAVAPKKPSPSFLRFWNWAEENCRCSQNLWRRRNVVKTETQQTFVNGLLGLLLSILYSAGSACVLLTIIMSCPSIWATLSISLIYFWVPSSCFASDQPLSEGEIIPFSGVCQSGGSCIITPEAVVASRTD